MQSIFFTVATLNTMVNSWISDLNVTLRSPLGTSVVFHNNERDDGDDIVRIWTSNDFAKLQTLHGEDVRGDWALHIVDKASADVGRLLYWQLDMGVDADTGGVIEDRAEPKIDIPDFNTTGIVSSLQQTQVDTVKDIVVLLDIEHTYIGDLQVELVAPSGISVLLHNSEGGWQDNIKRDYDVETKPDLQRFIGETIKGDW